MRTKIDPMSGSIEQRRGMRRGMERGMGDLSGMERCPLSGAAKAIASIEGAVMLIIGTEECSYYTKASLQQVGRAHCCYSVEVNKQDVTFGSGENVASAIEELMEELVGEHKPTALFLVTTCVPEIIGEDYKTIATETEEKYQIPVHIISTNHYSGKDGEYGFQLVEEATGAPLQQGRMGHGRNMDRNTTMGGFMMGKMTDMARRMAGKGQGGRPDRNMS